MPIGGARIALIDFPIRQPIERHRRGPGENHRQHDQWAAPNPIRAPAHVTVKKEVESDLHSPHSSLSPDSLKQNEVKRANVVLSGAIQMAGIPRGQKKRVEDRCSVKDIWAQPPGELPKLLALPLRFHL